MRRVVFAILLLSAVAWHPRAEGPWTAYYVLPEGRGFKDIGFFAESRDGILLRFADEIELLEELKHGSMVWFRCAVARAPVPANTAGSHAAGARGDATKTQGDAFFYLPEAYLTMPSRGRANDARGNLAIGRELVDPFNSVSIRYTPDDLEAVPPRYLAVGIEGRELLLRKEAREKFMSLIDEAGSDGVDIRILSAYRSALYQAFLYEGSIGRHGVFQNRVAKPGHSEHQLGTTCDLTTKEIENGLSVDFERTTAFAWLRENGYRYGIYLSYPKYGERITGYTYEPWHYRYFGDGRWEDFGERGRVFIGR